MADPNYRQERIERLLEELRYEVTRGMMEGEIDEHLRFQFMVPTSKTYPRMGVVACRFETRPFEHQAYCGTEYREPRLRVVGGKDYMPTSEGDNGDE